MIQKKFASSAKLSTLQIAEWFYHNASVPPGNDARKSCLNKHIVFFFAVEELPFRALHPSSQAVKKIRLQK